jgi:DNA-binding transcriptional ArsR family regulator
MTHEDVFQALADPTRRRVVAALRRGELSVNAIAEAVGIHQSGVSRHLSILSAAGFVAVRTDGAKRFYALQPAPFRELAAWLGRYAGLFERRELKRRDRRSAKRWYD